MDRMNWTGFVTAVLLLAGATACSDPGTGTDAATQADAATDMGMTVNCDDAGFVPSTVDSGNCYLRRTCNGMPFCPGQVANPTMRPQFVFTQIDIRAPVVLAPSSPGGMTLARSIADGRFWWGLTFDLAANQLRTGPLQPTAIAQPGLGFFSSTFQYYAGNASTAGDAGGSPTRWDPATVALTLTGETVATNALIPSLLVPVFSSVTPGQLLTELPLRNVRLHDVVMNTSRNCVGMAKALFSSCLPSLWVTAGATGGGVLEADIAVSDARPVVIPELQNITLCQLISGTDCSMPQSAWINQPDTMLPGSTTVDAWHLRAEFAAVSANIQ